MKRKSTENEILPEESFESVPKKQRIKKPRKSRGPNKPTLLSKLRSTLRAKKNTLKTELSKTKKAIKQVDRDLNSLKKKC